MTRSKRRGKQKHSSESNVLDRRGTPPPIPWRAYFSRKGWAERRRRILDGARSVYAIATIRRRLGLKAADFKESAIELYHRVNVALSQSDLTTLRKLTTSAQISRMKNQMKARADLDWQKMRWSVARDLQPRDIEIVQARVIALQEKHDAFTFAQLTIKINASVKFAAYNTTGKLIKGSAEKPFNTTDYWVVERSFLKAPSAKWRLASQISDIPKGQEKGVLQRIFF